MTYIKPTYIFFGLLYFLLTACNSSGPETLSTEQDTEVQSSSNRISITKKQFEASGYQIGKSTTRRFSNNISVSGQIKIPDKNKAYVSTLVDGTVGSFNLIEGQRVKKGQFLFTVTNPLFIELQEEYLTLKEELNFNTTEESRISDLLKENLTTKDKLLSVQSKIRLLQTKISGLTKKLSLFGFSIEDISSENLKSSIAMFAPINGYISDIDILRGMHIESAHPAMTIINTHEQWIELQILEKDINSIKVGQMIDFHLQDDTNLWYSAKVFLIDSEVHENRMVKVLCRTKNLNQTLMGGSFVTAKIYIDSLEYVAVPNTSIVSSEDASYILKLIKDESDVFEFEKIAVKAIIQDKGYTAIEGDIDTIAQILTKGAYFLIQD